VRNNINTLRRLSKGVCLHINCSSIDFLIEMKTSVANMNILVTTI
jgi:hypothetical protein